jgi:hypothetical protein
MNQKRIRIVTSGLIVSLWFIVLFVLWAYGFLRVEGIWFITAIAAIRISTLATKSLCFSLVIFLRRKNTWKAIYYALVAVVFSMGLYEFVWYYISVALRGFEPKIFQFAALFGWILLGVREVYSSRPSRVCLVLYGIYVASMVVWVATGFQYNDLGNTGFTYLGESLNVMSKTALTLGYALHIGEEGKRD